VANRSEPSSETNDSQNAIPPSQVTGKDELSCSVDSLNLDVTEEDSEEEEEEEEEEVISDKESGKNDSHSIVFTPLQVAQAFSHFSYAAS
jgi:hypothetical protein